MGDGSSVQSTTLPMERKRDAYPYSTIAGRSSLADARVGSLARFHEVRSPELMIKVALRRGKLPGSALHEHGK